MSHDGDAPPSGVTAPQEGTGDASNDLVERGHSGDAGVGGVGDEEERQEGAGGVSTAMTEVGVRTHVIAQQIVYDAIIEGEVSSDEVRRSSIGETCEASTAPPALPPPSVDVGSASATTGSG